MSKPERRRQLLETAQGIVSEAGTEALTLQTLAERAGVTKPIAYEHFGSREGALIALYRRLDDEHVNAAREAMAQAPGTLDAVCEIIAASYIDCCVKLGPAFGAISAALEASDEMHAVKTELRDTYLSNIRMALKPFVTLSPANGRALIIGFIGAADALGAEAAAGRMPRKAAIAVLAQLMCGTLSAHRAD
ncbi:MAG: TetR/AcrR family transcriptional regulator [Candidatus Phaeomarinobacter sp.]